VPEIHASRDQIRSALPDDFNSLDGTDVIVGIVDHGCDFAHPNFRGPDERTRILFLWDQRGGTNTDLPPGEGGSPEPYGYGREFSAKALDKALNEHPQTPQNPEAPHQSLGYQMISEHGTGVMDVAVGNGGKRNPPGVAPGAHIIFVDASLGEDLKTGESYGNSRHLLEAVMYIFDRAHELDKQAVVNISLNYDGGPHDGSTPVEEGFDRLLETPGRAIVIAAGNSSSRDIHLKRLMHPGQTRTLPWLLADKQDNNNKLEIWYGGKHSLALTLRSPAGQELGPVALGSTYKIRRKEEEAGYVFHRKNDSANGDNNIVILFGPLMEPGLWEIDLRALRDEPCLPFDIHAWAECDVEPSTFPSDVEDPVMNPDNAYTIGTLACGHSTIAVGAYNPLQPEDRMDESSQGPTRDGKLKPEVSAPGMNIKIAKPKSDSTQVSVGGTSLAAPHVTGLIALLMQAAAGKPLPIDRIRELVIDNVRDGPPPIDRAWDTSYGFGRIDVAAALSAQHESQPAPLIVLEHEETLIKERFSLSASLDGSLVSWAMNTETRSVMTTSLVEVANGPPQTHTDAAPTNGGIEKDIGLPPASTPQTRGH
jgi:subtilisin family serine protease